MQSLNQTDITALNEVNQEQAVECHAITGSTYVLQEEVQLGVAAGVDGDFEQRHEDVLQHLLEVCQLLFGSVNVAAWHKHFELCCVQ